MFAVGAEVAAYLVLVGGETLCLVSPDESVSFGTHYKVVFAFVYNYIDDISLLQGELLGNGGCDFYLAVAEELDIGPACVAEYACHVVKLLSLNFKALLSVYNPDHPKTAGVECGVILSWGKWRK